MSQSAVEKFVDLIIKSDSPYSDVDRIYVTNLILDWSVMVSVIQLKTHPQ